MPNITIPISDEDVSTLQTCTSHQGVTVEEYLAETASTRCIQHKGQIHPDVIRATGVIRFEGDPRAAYIEYMEKKHA